MSGPHSTYQPGSLWNFIRPSRPYTTVVAQGSYALVVRQRQTGIDGPAPVAPSRALLQNIAQATKTGVTSLVGRLVGGFTVKGLAGLMIGFGTVACIAGGAGVPLLCAGAVLFFVSTALSFTAQEDRRSGALAAHLVKSAVAAGIGFGCAYMFLAIGEIVNPVVKTLFNVAGAHVMGPLFFADLVNINNYLDERR